jgi:outer membrane beta-barrel protein
MHTTSKLLILAAVCTAAGVLSPTEAHARKKGVLEGEPIVRKRQELRKFRFQVAPYVGMSLSQPFVHMGYVGGKLTFHFADWIGLRAGFGYGVIKLNSKLLRAINDGGLPVGIPPGEDDPDQAGPQICPSPGAPCRSAFEQDNPAPLLHDFRAGLTRAEWQSSVDVVFTPFSGKLGIFSAIFTEYDIYLFGGLGLVGFKKHYDQRSTSQLLGLPTGDVNDPMYCSSAAAGQNSECLLHPVKADDGVKVGGSFGAGLHLFLGVDWVALNFEIQDIVTRNNLAGLNNTVEDVPPVVDKRDRDFFHNVTLQVGANFYFPPRAKRSK